MQTFGERIGVSCVLTASPGFNQPGEGVNVMCAKWIANRLTLCLVYGEAHYLRLRHALL